MDNQLPWVCGKGRGDLKNSRHDHISIIAAFKNYRVLINAFVWYGIVWYCMVWYGMVWYGMVLYCTVPTALGCIPVKNTNTV